MKRQELTTEFVPGKRYQIFLSKNRLRTSDIDDYRILFTANIIRAYNEGSFTKLILRNCWHESSRSLEKEWTYTTNFQVMFMEVENLEFKSSHREGVEL